MGSLKRLIEWYLGVPAADAGQDTAWRLHADRVWSSWLPDWLVFLLGVALLLGVIGVYRRDAMRLPRGTRVGLILLRLAVLGVAVAMLSQLALSIERTGLPFIVVLVDDSASMTLDDDYGDTTNDVRQLSGIVSGPISRQAVMQAILTSGNGRFLKRLMRRHQLRIYRFSDAAQVLGESRVRANDDLSETIGRVQDLEADGIVSRPGAALLQVLGDFRGSAPTAVVMLTDGVSTGDQEGSFFEIRQRLGDLSVPVFVAGLGNEDAVRDVQLFDIRVDDVAIVDDPVIISGRIRAQGYPGARAQVLVTNRETGEILEAEEIRLPVNSEPMPIEVVWTPRSEQDLDLVIQVTEQPGERNVENNVGVRHVSVRAGRIRVLLADDVPRWEFRYIKALLERQGGQARGLELHSLLFDADTDYATQDDSAVALQGRFPVTRDALFEYDVVILGDVDPSFLSAGMMDNLRAFVRDRGAGLVMVAGTRHNPIAYRGTELENLLPIELGRVPGPGSPIDPFRAQPTLQGQRTSAVLRFADSELASLEAWNRLPNLRWLVQAPALSPGATVLVEHPDLRGDTGRLPVVVAQQFGAGKVVFHATDELWRWRRNTGDHFYGRYWIQLIRWLSRSRLLDRDRVAELTSDRLIYQSSEPVMLRLRFFDASLIPVTGDDVSINVERRDGTRQSIGMQRVASESDQFEAQLGTLPEGGYHVWVESPSFAGAPPTTDFRVETPGRELRERSLARGDLMALAKMTHGKYYDAADALRLPSDIPAGRPVTVESRDPIQLWSRLEPLLLLVMLLTAEWIIRKRARLL